MQQIRVQPCPAAKKQGCTTLPLQLACARSTFLERMWKANVWTGPIGNTECFLLMLVLGHGIYALDVFVQFAISTATIVSGAVAERVKFIAYGL